MINALAPLANIPILVVATNIISGGNGNGVIDFNECNNLTIILTNESTVTATGIQATLISTTSGAIVAQGISSYPTLGANASASNQTPFTLSTEPTFVCGTPVNLTLVVKSAQRVETNFIQLPSGIMGSCQDGGGQCAGADLSLAMSATPSTVFVGGNVVYNFTVSNAGPSSAQSVAISQILPPVWSISLSPIIRLESFNPVRIST